MPATVEPGYASWLKAEARLVTGTVAGAAEKWNDLATDTAVTTALAFKADAQPEADAQAAFYAGPIARDRITVPGLLAGLIGKVRTIVADRDGYQGGAAVFIIDADESETVKVTTLTVLKRL